MFRLAALAHRALIAAALLVHTELMAQSKPADAATAFFNAITEGEWRRAARLVDPEALAEARDIELGMLASWAEVRPDLQRLRNGGMQGISFGGELDMSLVEKHRDLVVDLFGVRTLGEVAALSPEELFAHGAATSGWCVRIATSSCSAERRSSSSGCTRRIVRPSESDAGRLRPAPCPRPVLPPYAQQVAPTPSEAA